MRVDIVILAAGQGSRMKSSLPKVLHRIAGKPMVQHVIERAQECADHFGGGNIHVVVGHGGEQVKSALQELPVSWVDQLEQKGTGHAVAQALPNIKGADRVLVLYGDVPLTLATTLIELVGALDAAPLSLLTVTLDDPTGYGRIIRSDNGDVTSIVEHKDASEVELKVAEVNTGILASTGENLGRWLPALDSNNAQGEFYLTDIVAMAVKEGGRVAPCNAEVEQEVQGVNNRMQLASLERWYQRQQADRLMAEGATLMDPSRIDVRGTLSIGNDVLIDVNTVFTGKVEIGEGASIGPNCVISDSTIGEGSVIKANTVLEQAIVGNDCEVGPYARLRPGTELEEKAKIGNFVETKKTKVGEGSKINHLSYVGDAELGTGVNVGAGTITCNYDGVNKFKTEIKDGAFIGSNTSLVAPVSIGENATTGAGSTVTKSVADGELAVARGRQKNISGWQRPVKTD
ncbi:bifunctional UDP-N-acetylglucosamine diphosphorylase/glucosamine-1-phosphate N-acetyltransferase GlmU [Aestuariirhabdus sp. Z084]|uniref:bifunctional UDP-N-acetylglucosamine diphosphorylase/glucosamine-1-phosphate N-acetyltransferase GlmU n=1 Tax=Aestuariirhabdus haliotis TaxID=2918751 RepID=UPI00201B3F50|nr:bifunctional UDP-N-acetylglucosamine diphosphorylase/glucosamine-1-phosphate N-acetyltransferase GlmU [Aestuariirhabdus haliotis]MCL6414220.1 bifunctional UDP-N-acetylglucosamine diphosphorylase/glucosamine-1-phosphate N-acetyltransferase GlmU [Aestuariirhabdus haliotis]MCL6418152.1 bifunctional UDP-N-acetylglucosamine diphosphorylase/glucosamine-1-phosphate N-acetyltransferase GlmU [Aestuariirhabdus haliotis]